MLYCSLLHFSESPTVIPGGNKRVVNLENRTTRKKQLARNSKESKGLPRIMCQHHGTSSCYANELSEEDILCKL